MKTPPPDPAAAELRELIREAHGAAKDLRQLLREARQLLADGAEQARQAARQAGSEELARYSRHLQKEMNRAAAKTNASIDRAQKHILDALTLTRLEPDPDDPGKLRFYFKGNLFNEIPLPDGPEPEPLPTPACPRCGQPRSGCSAAARRPSAVPMPARS